MKTKIQITLGFALALHSSLPYADEKNDSAILKVENIYPLTVSILDKHGLSRLSAPQILNDSLEDGYHNVYTHDIDGNGVDEVVIELTDPNATANSCVKILHYNGSKKKLQEAKFELGDICNYRHIEGYLVSSFRDQAYWTEIFYNYKNGETSLKFLDTCIGCDYIKREIFKSETIESTLLVSNEIDFTKRESITSEIIIDSAPLYPSANDKKAATEHLTSGDLVKLLENKIDSTGNWWFRIRHITEHPTEGWLRCEALSICKSAANSASQTKRANGS